MIEIQWIMCCLSSVFSFSRSHPKKKGSTDRYGHYLKGKRNEKSLIDSEIIHDIGVLLLECFLIQISALSASKEDIFNKDLSLTPLFLWKIL